MAFLAASAAWAAYAAYARQRGLPGRHGGATLLLPALPWALWLPVPRSLVAQWAVWGVALLPNAVLLGLLGRWLGRPRASRPAR